MREHGCDRSKADEKKADEKKGEKREKTPEEPCRRAGVGRGALHGSRARLPGRDARAHQAGRRWTKKFIERTYGKIGNIESSERLRRMDAIKRFQRFIQEYPNDKQYTPDAMFRLYGLYYEYSAVRYNDAQEQFEKDTNLYERGKIRRSPRCPSGITPTAFVSTRPCSLASGPSTATATRSLPPRLCPGEAGDTDDL